MNDNMLERGMHEMENSYFKISVNFFENKLLVII